MFFSEFRLGTHFIKFSQKQGVHLMNIPIPVKLAKQFICLNLS